jgi:hypothetical protein
VQLLEMATAVEYSSRMVTSISWFRLSTKAVMMTRDDLLTRAAEAATLLPPRTPSMAERRPRTGPGRGLRRRRLH